MYSRQVVNWTFASGVLNCIFCVFITVVSLGLLIAILSSRKLRNQLRPVLIASGTVAELILGVAVCSTQAAHFLGVHGSSLNCGWLSFTSIYNSYVGVFLSCWILVILNISFFVEVLEPKYRELSSIMGVLFRLVVALIPWLLVLIVIVPILMAYLEDLPPQTCGYRLDPGAAVALEVLTFYLPVSLALLMSVGNWIAYWRQKTRHQDTNKEPLLSNGSTNLEHPSYLLLATMIVILCQLPMYVMKYAPPLQYDVMMIIYFAFNLLKTFKSAILPFVWLLHRHVRAGIVACLKCRCNQEEEKMPVSYVSYKSLQTSVTSMTGSVNEEEDGKGMAEK